MAKLDDEYIARMEDVLEVYEASKHGKAPDFAEVVRDLGRSYSDAKKTHLVMDNLNTHCLKSLMAYLGPKRGTNLWARFEFQCTPKHASWLNQAETQIRNKLEIYARKGTEDDEL